MLSEAIEKRVDEINAICSEIPLVVANHGWSDYALELIKKLQRLIIVLDDEEDEDGVDDIISEIIEYKRARPEDPPKDGAVGVYVVKDGKLLAGTRITPNGFNKLCGPGGLIESGETPHDAAVRETQEEFSIEPIEMIQFGIGEKGSNGIEPVLFLCTEFNGDPICDEVEMTKPVWKSVSELENDSDSLYAPFRDGIQRLKEAVYRQG